MGIFSRFFKKASRSDPEQLRQTLAAFIRADSPAEAERIVKQHPELLSNEAAELLEQVLAVQTNEQAMHVLTGYQKLLHHCRTEGVEAAFARLMQPVQSAAPNGTTPEIPAECEAEIRELQRLTGQAQRNPRLYSQCVVLIESVLQRLRPDQYLIFRTGLLNSLANAYQSLPTGERAANLQQAIACFREALRFLTPEATPLHYALTQNSLANAYQNLPTGERATNLEQAIACHREALRFYTPEAMPREYALTQNSLANAYWSLPTGERAANLEQAIACHREALRFLIPEATPHEYALTQNSLGDAYADLLTGERAANLEQAIACYREALRFLTPEATPHEYALTQNSLGDAYADLLTGERVANLQQAIACYREALRFLTPEATPHEYALTQHHLGAAYWSLPTGERAANLEQAIACYREALRFRTPEATPREYALTQHHLGNAYGDLLTSEQAANLEQALACYREALCFFTPEADPREYAKIQHNLGTAYQNLPTGEQAANLQQALACYQEALRFRTPGVAPLDYAMTQHNLGDAYASLPTGERAANLQQALACFREALRFFTPEATPHEYARTQFDLGNAYADLLTGDRAANLQQAIDYFREALRFLTPGAMPRDYALTQNSLGNAYWSLPTGERAANLEQAIACYQEALRFLTPEAMPRDYAMIQHNLGHAYWSLPTGERAANLRQAIDYFREALHFRTPEAAPFDYARTQNSLGNAYWSLPTGDRAANLQQAIACYQEALRFFTPEAMPRDYALTQNSLGNVYRDSPTGDRAANLQQAITCFREALRFYTPEADPRAHRNMTRNLGNLYFGEGHWQEAHSTYTTGIDTGETLYQTAATEIARQATMAEAADIVPNDAYCLARLGRFVEAVERLEAGKARALADALARDRAALAQATADDRTAFEAARARIRALEIEARTVGAANPDRPSARSFTELSSDLRAARQELDAIVQRIRAYVHDFMPVGIDFKAIAAAAAPARPLVYLITTSQGSLALIVPPGAKTLDARHAVWLDEFRADDLNSLLVTRDANGDGVSGYLVGQVGGGLPVLKTALDQVLPILEAQLMGPLVTRLADLGFRQMTLIPGGRLGLLPLHASAFAQCAVTFAPSARALHAAISAAGERAGLPLRLFGVGNPLSSNLQPLAFARIEVEELASLFANEARCVLYEQQVTRVATLKALPKATHLHFACHGAFEAQEPLDSALFLSGTERVTLRDLIDGDLEMSAARLAVLSACQTGITDFRNVPDEAIGFPAGFLQAGVPGVISTLWPVNDLSTPVLLTQFYRFHVGEKLEPATALYRAQQWLCSATGGDIADYWERVYQASGGCSQSAFEAMSYYRSHPASKPLAHPYYWAAFTFSGV